MSTRIGYRSLFWPLILIGVGVLWLLGNIGVLNASHFAALWRLWPLLLIAVGLDLLFGRSSPTTGAIIGIGTLVLALVLMFLGPSVGLTSSTTVENSTYSAPLDGAEEAHVTLDLSVGRSTISALQNSDNLIDLDLNHIGGIDFRVGGNGSKEIYLGSEETNISFNPPPFFGLFPGSENEELYWDIKLSPEIPLDLTINGGVGKGNLDLSDLMLSALDVDGGVGEMTLNLPGGEPYDATINTGVGSFTLTVAEDASVNLDINGGVGELTIDVPDNAAVRLDASTGLGGVRLPSFLSQVSGDNDDGVWETDGFADADQQINISFDGGVGQLSIR